MIHLGAARSAERLYISSSRLLNRVVNSGQFSGVAEMVSEVEFDKIFNYWWEDLKWSGVFKINWVFVKDVHHVDVQDIRVNGTPIHQLKDGSHVDFDAGKRMLEMFKHSEIDSDIFEAFEYMDEREEKLRIKRDSYYEMIKQLKAKGLIPDSVKQNHYFKGHKYNNNYPHKKNNFKYNRGFKGYKDHEVGGKPGFFPNKHPDDNSEYIKKQDSK